MYWGKGVFSINNFPGTSARWNKIGLQRPLIGGIGSCPLLFLWNEHLMEMLQQSLKLGPRWWAGAALCQEGLTWSMYSKTPTASAMYLQLVLWPGRVRLLLLCPGPKALQSCGMGFFHLAPMTREGRAAPNVAVSEGGRHHSSIPSKLMPGAGAPILPSTC